MKQLLEKLWKDWNIGEIIYSCTHHFATNRIKSLSEENAHETFSILNNFSSDKGHSCITNKNLTITYKYDLQIIVPCYKVENYLSKCVDSILNQKTKYNILVVFIDDASPDHSKDILNHINDPRAIVIHHPQNKGLSGARNTGLQKIQAKYITFVDSDDYLSDNAIDSLLDTAYKYDSDIVEGGYYKLCNSSITIGRSHPLSAFDSNKNLYGYSWGKVFKSELFNNIYFPEGLWFEDTLCSFILYDRVSKISLVDTIVYYYRINPQGICCTAKGNPKVLDTLYITMQLLADRQKLSLPMDKFFLRRYISQCRTNSKRIASLHSKTITLKVFQLQNYMLHYYFPNVKKEDTNDRYGHLLIEGDFGGWNLALKLKL